MVDDVALAFAHPFDRSAATGSAELDRISVRDLIVTVEIGAFQAERDTTQRIRFNVVVEVLPINASGADDVDTILSYDRITEAIHGELSAERLNLLETLAERIADRILLEPQAARVFVRIEKIDRGPGVLGVEIVRDAKDGDITAMGDAPRPVVVLLGADAIDDGAFQPWLDAACDHEGPVVFCVEPISGISVDEMHGKNAKDRVTLLAIEQAAWMLAGQDERFKVVGTWTELDWGMRNNQVSIVAPSKIVMDAVNQPSRIDSPTVADWVANELDATKVIFVGVPAIEGLMPMQVCDPKQVAFT